MHLKKLLDNILEKVLITLMAVMVINVLWQVASRYLVQSPSSFTDELARYLLIWISMLGASYAVGKRMHLSIDLLSTKLNRQHNARLNTLIYIIVALFSLMVMVLGGSRLVYITFTLHQISPALEVPMAFVYSVLPIGGLVIIFYSIINILYPEKEEDSSISETLQ